MCVFIQNACIPVRLVDYILAHTSTYTYLQHSSARVSGCRGGAARDAWSQGVAFELCVLGVQRGVPPQVDEIECMIPAYEGLALK